MSVASIGRNGLRNNFTQQIFDGLGSYPGDHPRQEMDLISGAVREAVWHVM